jgi:hypothetical protein
MFFAADTGKAWTRRLATDRKRAPVAEDPFGLRA